MTIAERIVVYTLQSLSKAIESETGVFTPFMKYTDSYDKDTDTRYQTAISDDSFSNGIISNKKCKVLVKFSISGHQILIETFLVDINNNNELGKPVKTNQVTWSMNKKYTLIDGLTDRFIRKVRIK